MEDQEGLSCFTDPTPSTMTLEEFKSYSTRFAVVPVSRVLVADTLTPVSAYLRLRDVGKSSFLFESVEGGENIARYSFIGNEPIVTIECRGNSTTITEGGQLRTTSENFFEIINQYTQKFSQPQIPELPRFTGGLVGYIGYDAVRFAEELPTSPSATPPVCPDSILGLFAVIVAFDHLKHRAVIIKNVFIDQSRNIDEQFEEAQSALASVASRLKISSYPIGTFSACTDQIRHETSREEFMSLVRKARAHIYEGDIFQVVLSQRFSVAYTGDAFHAYRALRIINPSPYLYYLDFNGVTLIGSSPEVLIRKDDTTVETYPIAGTRPRGKNDAEDRALEADLRADAKECAEHIMLVDLGRNDLGRVCEPGSVAVENLMTIVRYSHVMHLASRVRGNVRAEKRCVDLFQAAFPAGTVSGAPKIRAMAIIEELENMRRGFYAGGVGYFDFSGRMDFCITIRTMMATSDRIYFQAGAGIVADSDPSYEYNETLNKSQALVDALRMAGEIQE